MTKVDIQNLYKIRKKYNFFLKLNRQCCISSLYLKKIIKISSKNRLILKLLGGQVGNLIIRWLCHCPPGMELIIFFIYNKRIQLLELILFSINIKLVVMVKGYELLVHALTHARTHAYVKEKNVM